MDLQPMDAGRQAHDIDGDLVVAVATGDHYRGAGHRTRHRS